MHLININAYILGVQVQRYQTLMLCTTYPGTGTSYQVTIIIRARALATPRRCCIAGCGGAGRGNAGARVVTEGEVGVSTCVFVCVCAAAAAARAHKLSMLLLLRYFLWFN